MNWIQIIIAALLTLMFRHFTEIRHWRRDRTWLPAWIFSNGSRRIGPFRVYASGYKLFSWGQLFTAGWYGYQVHGHPIEALAGALLGILVWGIPYHTVWNRRECWDKWVPFRFVVGKCPKPSERRP